MHSSQVATASKGVFWVNSQALYFYDGEELKNISSDLFGIDSWVINEDSALPVILGYDRPSNKIIIMTPNVLGQEHGGNIYDISNNSIVKCEKLFNWYPVFNEVENVVGEQDDL